MLFFFLFFLWNVECGKEKAFNKSDLKNLADSLEDIFPYLTVIESMTPAHLNSSNNDVLFKNIRAQFSVHNLTLFQGDLKNPQHECQDGTCYKRNKNHKTGT